MPKLTPAQMKKAVEEFKKKFTGGFFHGSSSPNIQAFDASKGSSEFPVEGVTFVTRDTDFAESFLPMTERGAYKTGATMYPVNVNLGKFWDPNTKEGRKVVEEYLKQTGQDANQYYKTGLKRGNWEFVEDPEFLNFLRNKKYDTFHVEEGGIPNVGIFDPKNIRGKFAKFNPEDAESPEFMKAEGGLVHLAGGGVPEKIVKAYKLFRTKKNDPETLYPLFVNANKPVPIGEWVTAEVGPVAASGKVKSKLGELAYRPGWHAGDLPIATHIGGKSQPGLKAPDYRRPGEVWAEVEMPADVNWQDIANQRAKLNKAGKIIPSTAHITDEIPLGGHYRYKTSPNMEGNWLIGGEMKVNRILTDEEVQAINEAAGRADLPRFVPFDEKAEGGLVQHFQLGGAAKRVLEHARKLPFVHFSKAPDISYLEPRMYGTGIKGAEASRLANAPDIKPRSYFYVDTPNVRPEAGLGPHKYQGIAEDIYPLHEDPLGLSAIAKQKSLDPYLMSQGIQQVNEAQHLNELERLIKKAGYKGYANDEVGLLFEPTPVRKAVEGKAGGGSVFNPESSGYDYQTALAYGMGPTGTGEDEGHWGSVAPTSDDERMLRDLPRDSYVMLKGKAHETFNKAEAAEKERGSKIVKIGDRYYSIPK